TAVGGGVAWPPDAARGLGRGARPAGPELARRREVQRGDRPGRGRRAGLGRRPPQRLRSALATAGVRTRISPVCPSEVLLMSRFASLCASALLVVGCSAAPSATSTAVPASSPPPATGAAATTAPSPTATPVATNEAGVRTCVSSSQGPERTCPLDAGTYATEFQTPALTYTVPSAGWGSLDREVSPGNFHLFPPGSSMAGFETGSGDVITVI